MDANAAAAEIIDSALKVHRRIGPGVMERVYEACLAIELRKRGLVVETQKAMPIFYEGVELDLGYRLDLLVEHRVVVELKVVTKLLPVHTAQLLSYLRLGGFKLGSLLNFHEARIKDGIVRIAN